MKQIGSLGRRCAALIAGALLCVCMSSAVLAQAAGKSEYDVVLRQALEEFDRGNWVEARTYFERAHAMQPSARTLRAIGLCAFEEKQYVLAVKSLMEALDHGEKPLTEKQRKEVVQAMGRASSFIARYTLELTPADARIQVDGASASTEGGVLLVDPGKHDIVVSAPGYETAQHTIVAQPNTPGSLRIELRQVSEAAAIVETSIAPQEPRPQPVAPSEQEDSGLSTWQYVGIGVGGVGVVSLGASLVFAISASSKYDESGCADGGCRDLAAQRLNEEAIDAGNIATVTAIAGTVLTAGGVLLFFATGESETQDGASAGLRVTPIIAPALSGVSLGGRF